MTTKNFDPSEFDRLYFALIGESFEKFEAGFLAFEHRMLPSLSSAYERRELKRRVAEWILDSASRKGSPDEFFRALQRMKRRGFSIVEKRVGAACMFWDWATEHEHYLTRARTALRSARRAVVRLPAKSAARKELLGAIAMRLGD